MNTISFSLHRSLQNNRLNGISPLGLICKNVFFGGGLFRGAYSGGLIRGGHIRGFTVLPMQKM